MIALKSLMIIIISKTMKILKWTQMNMDLMMKKILNSTMIKMLIWKKFRNNKTFKKVMMKTQNPTLAQLSLNSTKHRDKPKMSRTRTMKNFLKVIWKCLAIQNSTKRLKDWSNKVFGETLILKLKKMAKWNKVKNRIKITFRIKLNITHKMRKESVKIHMVTKIKIMKIKMYSINRINSKNLRSRAITMNLQVFKKRMLTNPLKTKFKIKTKMRVLRTQNNKPLISQRTHS